MLYDFHHATFIINPIYKGGYITEPNYYRPISLLSNIAKIFEICIKSCLVKYLRENDILATNQYAFTRSSSTAVAIFDVTKYIYNALNENEKIVTLFSDIKKAHKIKGTGFRKNAYPLFRSYLYNRTQAVKVNDAVSPTKTLKSGPHKERSQGPYCFLFTLTGCAKYMA